MRIALMVFLLPFWGCGTTPSATPHKGFAQATPRESNPEARALAHYLAAAVLERQGKFEEAITQLRKASDLSPASTSLSIKLIQAYLRMGDQENARQMCERAVAATPDDARLWLVLGHVYQELKRYDDAKDAYAKAIRIDPDDVLAYQAIVELQESTNDLISAIDMCRRLLELRPQNARLHLQLGLNLARCNDAKGAAAALERAAEINPNLTEALYLLGLVYLDLDENQKATDVLARYVKEKPENANASENLAGALARIGKRDEAYAILEELTRRPAASTPIEPSPDAPISLDLNRTGPTPEDQATIYPIKCIYLLLRQGRLAEAEAIVPPDGAPILGTVLRSILRKQKGEPYRPILDSLDQVEGDIDAECGDILLTMFSLFGKEETAEYFAATLRGLREDGARSKYLDIILARALMALERNEEAAALLDAGLKAYGSDRWLHYYLATAYESLKKFADTETHLKACIALAPDDPDLKNFLGYMYAEQNIKLDEAETLIRQALERDPDNGAYLDSLGWVYYRKGDADRAIDLIRKAIRAMPSDDPVLRDHLGDAYRLKGDAEKAVAEWERAHRLDPKLEGVVDKINAHRAPAPK